MPRTLVTVAALVLAAAAARSAEAQDLAELRARMARLQAQVPRLDAAAMERAKRRAELNRPGQKPASAGSDRRPEAVIAWGRSGGLLVGLERPADAEAVAGLVDSSLRAIGLDSSFRARLVIAEMDRIRGHRLSDADARLVAGREIDHIALPGGQGNTTASDRWRAWTASVALAKVGERITPSGLRPWTGPLSLQWDPAVASPLVIRELMVRESRLAPACLGGDGAACAAYLGIDTDGDPLRRRFPPADARHLAPGYAGGRDPLRARQCAAGAEDQCYVILERYGPPSASSDYARESLLMFVAERYGAAAFQRVLADTASQLGVRVVRATGTGPAELGVQWRSWVLATARVMPVRAGIREFGSALLSLALLLGLVTRGGRWFA